MKKPHCFSAAFVSSLIPTELTDWTAFSLVMILGSTSAANVNRTGYWPTHIFCSPWPALNSSKHWGLVYYITLPSGLVSPPRGQHTSTLNTPLSCATRQWWWLLLVSARWGHFPHIEWHMTMLRNLSG